MFVVILTLVAMVIAIIFGYLTGSMAILADAWHMASHVFALGISVIVYKLARSEIINKKFSFGAGKFIPLGGYTSALLLAMVDIVMAIESCQRLASPVEIEYNTAILIAVFGPAVNLISAWLLWDSHEHHHHEDTHDHNHKSALIHVIADINDFVFFKFYLHFKHIAASRGANYASANLVICFI